MIVLFWVNRAHFALGLHGADGLFEAEQVDRVEQELEEAAAHVPAPVNEEPRESAGGHETLEEGQAVVRGEEGEVGGDEAEADLVDERLLGSEAAENAVEEEVVVEVGGQHHALVFEVLDPAVDDFVGLVDLLRDVEAAQPRLLRFAVENLHEERERGGVQHDALRGVDRDLADGRQVQVHDVGQEALDEGQVVRHVRPVEVLLRDVPGDARVLFVREFEPLADEVALELRGLHQARLPALLADDFEQQLSVLQVRWHVLQDAEKIRFPLPESLLAFLLVRLVDAAVQETV